MAPRPIVTFDFTTAADQNPISTPWTSFVGPGEVAGKILGGKYVASANDSDCTILYDGGIVWVANQFAQGVLSALTPGVGFAGIDLEGGGYQMGIDTAATPGGLGLPSSLLFIRNGVQFAQRFSIVPQAGDLMLGTVLNGLLSFFQNGNLIGQIQDPVPLGAGKPGLTASPTAGALAGVAWTGVFAAGGTASGLGGGLLLPFPVVTVGAAGTPQQVSPTTINCNAVYFEALASNTGKVYIGLKNLVASTLVGCLRVLVPPPTTPLFLDHWQAQSRTSMGPIDLSQIYIDTDVNGEGVMISYLVG